MSRTSAFVSKVYGIAPALVIEVFRVAPPVVAEQLEMAGAS